MNEGFAAIRPDPALWADSVPLYGGAFLGNNFRRADKALTPVVAARILNRDRVFDEAEAIGSESAHDLQLQADRNSYELKESVQNIFGRIKNIPG